MAEAERDAANPGGSRDPFQLDGLLSQSAKTIGAGSSSDSGRFWRLPTEHPDPIVLAAGIPDAPTLPIDHIRGAVNRALDADPSATLTYGGWYGYDGLREAIAERQSRIEGAAIGQDNIIVHNGSSGAIDNVSKTFLQPGDVVIAEAPSFSGSVRSMRGYMVEVVEVPMEDEGVSVDALSEAIERVKASGKRPKLFYTVADYHNPTGVTLARRRREELLEVCARHGVLVLEDAAYTELGFDDGPPASLYSLAQGEGVLRLGSLSKTVATGLRVGWVQARPDFIDAMARVRFDMGNTPLLQWALADYMESGNLDEHVRHMRPLYAEKCEILVESLLAYCEPYVRFRRPEGGFFLWVECVGASARDVALAASQEGLVFPLGSNFFSDRESSDDNHVRMAFSAAQPEQLAEVGPRLRAAFHRVAD
jgi:2-aminoadipate transaminase